MSRARPRADDANQSRDFLNDLMRAIDREVTRQASLAVERSGIRGLTAVGQLVDKLEKNGLVVREGDPEDGRAVIIRPTEKANMAYRTARKAITAIETEWKVQLGDARAGAFERTLLRLKAWSEESERRGT